MLQKLLRLLGLGPKVDEIASECDGIRDTLREIRERIRADVGLDEVRQLNGRARTLAGKDGK